MSPKPTEASELPGADDHALEDSARAAFKSEYPDEYLAHLERTRDRRDLSELLWSVFAHGFAAGRKPITIATPPEQP